MKDRNTIIPSIPWEVEEELKMENVYDNVNHPKHYTQGNIECIDAMQSAFGKEAVKNFCLCNAFKYLWRSPLKGKEEDLEKAAWYLNKYAELGDSNE